MTLDALLSDRKGREWIVPAPVPESVRKTKRPRKVLQGQSECPRDVEKVVLFVPPRTAESSQYGGRSTEKLDQAGPAEWERVALVPQREQLARAPEFPWPKRKGTRPSVS